MAVFAAFHSIILALAMNMSLRQKLLNGGKSYGPLIMSDSPIIAEILALAGYGHIVVDHEHSPTDVRSGQRLLQAIQAANAITVNSKGASHQITEPIVRLPSPNDPGYMKKVLDSMTLPGGVLVPMVDDADMARAVVRSTRYPRQMGGGQDDEILDGNRGCAAPFVRGSSWGYQFGSKDYLQRCQDDLLVMVQVETPAGVEAIPEIAAVPGVDAIFLGPFDLSTSIGKMGQFDDPEVSKLISDAEIAVKHAPSCLLAGFRPPGRSLENMFEAGYSLVCGALDLAMIRDAAKRDADAGNDAIAKQ